MAILTALFSLIGKQVGKIVQAIFGWAITALFGRLPSAQQNALSAALIASIAWPLLVIGAFLPGVAAWALAFLPLHKWLGETALRLIWIALAVLIPLGVGGIAHWVAPPDKLKGGIARTLAFGYALTLGYFVAFIITAITVPIVQLISLVKRWGDEHVYVQPKPRHYDQVLAELATACTAAGCEVVVEPIPAAMQLATKAMKWFASGAMDPLLDEEPQRLVGKELEVYLYPADLLLRGAEKRIARVRAEMTRTRIESHAHLTSEPAAQTIEDELDAMWGVVERHESHGDGEHIGAAADARLREISKEADTVAMSFASWTMLQTGIRALERALEGARHLLPEEGSMKEQSREMQPDERTSRDSEARTSASTAQLLEQGLAQAKDLVRLEVTLAKDEALTELRALHSSYVAFTVCAACAVVATSALVASIIVATTFVVGLVASAVTLVGAASFGYAGYKRLPLHPMEKTRRRLVNDAHDIRERLA